MSKNSILIGVPYDLLNNGATLNPALSVSMPARRVQLTWQNVAAVAPSAVSLALEASNDDVTWDPIDTCTTVGEVRTVNTSAKFIRVNGSITGGTDNQVLVVAKA